jgi:hypothetical protein
MIANICSFVNELLTHTKCSDEDIFNFKLKGAMYVYVIYTSHDSNQSLSATALADPLYFVLIYVIFAVF